MPAQLMSLHEQVTSDEMMPRRLPIVVRSGVNCGARRPGHCCAQGSNYGAEMLGHRQRLPSEKEEERESHPPVKMRSVPKGAHNEGRSRRGLTMTKDLASDGCGRRQEGG